jgi:hypothetical protein
MGDRTGVGLTECAILEALEALGAHPGRRYRRNAAVLAAVEDRIGLAPAYAYEILLDLARPWTMPLSLIQGQGNFGSRGNEPAASPSYTESRLAAAGRVALAAERGDIAPVPIGLINGNVYAKGTRPPFRPQAVIDALRLVIQRPRVTSKELTDVTGPPYFLNGCIVTGDFTALAAGRPTVLRLEARLSISEDHHSVIIDNFPPTVNPDDTAQSLASRARVRDWEAQHPQPAPARAPAAQQPARRVNTTTRRPAHLRAIARDQPRAAARTAPGHLRRLHHYHRGPPAAAACPAQKLGPGLSGRGTADQPRRPGRRHPHPASPQLSDPAT